MYRYSSGEGLPLRIFLVQCFSLLAHFLLASLRFGILSLGITCDQLARSLHRSQKSYFLLRHPWNRTHLPERHRYLWLAFAFSPSLCRIAASRRFDNTLGSLSIMQGSSRRVDELWNCAMCRMYRSARGNSLWLQCDIQLSVLSSGCAN